MARSNVLEAVGSLYDAALDRQLWPQTLATLNQVFEGHAFSLFLLNKRTAEVPLMVSAGLSDEFLADFRSYYTALEPALPFLAANPRLPRYLDQMWIDERAIGRHEFYAWLERAGGVRYRLGGIIAETSHYFGLTASLRTARQGPAGGAEQKLFLRLLPHIRRATRISLKFGQSSAEHVARREALDHLSTGVLLFDRLGRIVFLNRVAEVVLEQHDSLNLDRAGRLRAGLPDEARALNQAIAAAAATGVGAGLDAGGAHSITRPSGRRPYLALVAPLGDHREVLGLRPAPAAVVFLTDPDQKTKVPIDLLRRSYALTAAEARLTDALARGHRVDEAATTLGVTAGTARSRLKAVFAKTNTHSQAELLRLVATLGSTVPAAATPRRPS